MGGLPQPDEDLPAAKEMATDWEAIQENMRLFRERARRKAAGLTALTKAAHPGDVKVWFAVTFPDCELMYELIIDPDTKEPHQQWYVETPDQAAYLKLWHG